jgi:uncharacterized protein
MLAAVPVHAEFGSGLVRAALLAGCANVIAERHTLNRINVFPVADGDTGTNLALTLSAVHAALHTSRAETVGALFSRAAIAAIDGARGNSGAIMAQFFFGLSEHLVRTHKLTLLTLSQAVEHAAKVARLALAEPKEGTVLSVISSYAHSLIKLCRAGERNVRKFFAQALHAARTALRRTPKALPVLALHGVVDAGGSGFVLFLEGVQRFVEQGRRARPRAGDALQVALGSEALHEAGAEHDSAYRYCSECLLHQADIPGLQRALMQIKHDSLVIAGGGDFARLHVHTDSPAELFEIAAQYAQVSQRKADDMAAQARGKHSVARVAIVSDTGADLPETEVQRLNIYTVPVRVNFGDEEFIDRVTLTPTQLYTRLRDARQPVRTSQPPGGEFRRLFDQLLSHYEAVVCLNVSARMSGTWQAALAAAKIAAPDRIHVLDTQNAAAGQALMVLRAAELALAGKSAAEIQTDFAATRALTATFAVIPDVRFLVQGGRVPAWVGPVSRLLSAKLLIADDAKGKIKPAGALWGERDLAARFARWAVRRFIARAGFGDMRIVLGHADAADAVQPCADALRKLLPHLRDLHIVDAGTAIGAHAGPGALVLGMQRVLALS